MKLLNMKKTLFINLFNKNINLFNYLHQSNIELVEKYYNYY